ncbi:MAG: amidase [Chloroflexi bacterium]|nr:amidase [Chloroflexota bacterium]
MQPNELCWLSATELSERLASRALSPVEVVDAYLDRAERLNPHLNAFLTILADSARDAARQAEKDLARGERRGPLHGIPVALKDVIYTRGVRTTMGSRIYADFVPDEDATVVERLRAAGAIVLAKAHTHEFAHGPTSNNPHYGPCHNPWDLQRIPGGSSGGSAASVAAGLCPIAIGTDTGGSIRIPGALCGVVGLKPTYGRVSRHGVFPVAWTFDHVGPLTRTVRDAALTLGVLAGADDRDRTTSQTPVPDYLAALTGDVRGLRIGVLREHLSAPLDEEVRTRFLTALRQLADLGALVDEVSLPIALDASAISGLLIKVETSAVHERHLRERPADYGADVRVGLLAGFALSGPDYLRVQRARHRLLADVARAFQHFDVLAGPTVPIPAPEIGQERVSLAGREHWVASLLSRHTWLHNATGYPAVTIPGGYTAAGLPVGLQISARPLDDATALRVADAYERATTDQRKRPRDNVA